MADILKMMKNAVLAQKNLKKIQDELKQKTVESSCAGGKVRAVACGDASLTALKIDPAILGQCRVEELEKMLLETVNSALEKAKKMSAEHMQSLMSDMGLPNIPGL
jgi:DNA-binding YbaB/EbfC family protein